MLLRIHLTIPPTETKFGEFKYCSPFFLNLYKGIKNVTRET